MSYCIQRFSKENSADKFTTSSWFKLLVFYTNVECMRRTIDSNGASRPLPTVSSTNDAMRSARGLQLWFELMGATG